MRDPRRGSRSTWWETTGRPGGPGPGRWGRGEEGRVPRRGVGGRGQQALRSKGKAPPSLCEVQSVHWWTLLRQETPLASSSEWSPPPSVHPGEPSDLLSGLVSYGMPTSSGRIGQQRARVRNWGTPETDPACRPTPLTARNPEQRKGRRARAPAEEGDFPLHEKLSCAQRRAEAASQPPVPLGLCWDKDESPSSPGLEGACLADSQPPSQLSETASQIIPA